MPDAATLTIDLVGADTEGPPGGLLFERTPRPGQGRLRSGDPTSGLVVVLISPATPGVAETLRDWADYVHISQIAAANVPGYTMITPYRRVPREPATGPWFLHLYELDATGPSHGDPEASFAAMTPLVRTLLPRDEFRRWGWHDALVIDYVSSFARRAR